MAIRKKAELLNLKDFGTYIELDDSLLSNNLFEILDFPEKLTAGKNLFKIRMQNDRFVDGSEVFIEILDFNGNPIYYEPLKYMEKDGTRVIAVYIYPETSPGAATIYVAGRIAIDSQGNDIPFSRDNSSNDYFQIPNVLWQRSLPVAPFASNTSEIIYTKQPGVTITEIVQPYRQPINIFNVFTERSASNTSFDIKPIPTKNESVKTSEKTVSKDSKEPKTEKTIFEGQFSKNSPNKNIGEQLVEKSSIKKTLSDTDGKTAVSETITTAVGSSLLTISNLPLSKSMEGGTITIVNPLVTVPDRTIANSDGQILPASQTRFQTNTVSAGTHPLSGSYNFSILNVLNKTKANVVQIDGFKNESDNTFGGFRLEIAQQGRDSIENKIIDSISTSTNITASFIKPTDVVFTENSSSFADIIISDTEPATGDVYRIKTLYKPSGFFGDFIDLGDTILEQQNILIDTSSLETNITIGSQYENFGQFESLQEIEKYWTGSVVGGLASDALSFAYDTDTMIGGVQLNTNWTNGGDQFTAQKNDASSFEIKSQYRPLIYTDTTYLVRFNIALPTDITSYSGVESINNVPRLDVYVNNDIEPDGPIQNIFLGDVQLPTNWTDTLASSTFAPGGTLGTRIGSVFANKNPEYRGSAQLQFRALSKGPLDLKFVTRNGKFIIADIEVVADKETGFTPGYTRISKRIPTEHLKTPLTFKFQYFDVKAAKADLETFAYGAVFDGGNQYIDGTDNIITGSVFIGNKIGSGIEIAGVSSGFLRSVGYQGFISASEGTGPGGFLIFSGSNNMTIGADTYTGVGLELVGENDNAHLIFTTSGSGLLDIKAEKFFIGSENTQFISGANSNIEISSSIFHLDPANNVLIIGADAVIEADLSANQLFVPAGTTKANARAYISSSGEAGFIGDGAGNYSVVLDGRSGQTSTIAGLTASAHSLSTATYTISASTNVNDPVSFISSSAFKVSAGGAVTGSSVLLGDKAGGNFLQFKGSTLTVQGDITADSISTPAAAPTPSASISAEGFATFVSASIAGFVVNTEEIKSENENLRLKSNGQITGSTVLFTGGKISGSAVDIITPKFFLGSDSQFVSGALGNIEISSSNFHLQPSGDVTMTGTITATAGQIGGFAITENAISSSNGNLRLKSSGQITGSEVLFTGGTIGGFEIKSDTISDSNGNLQLTGSTGTIKATQGTIGGFTLAADKITGNNIIIDSAGVIQTSDYASDVKGWKISAENNGFAEFENAKIRGTLSTAVFEKETVNAVGGQLYVANSTTLTSSALHPSDNYLPTDNTMSVVNVTGFATNEILTLKKVTSTGFSTEYVRVQSASRNDPSSENDFSGNLYVIRGYSGSVPTDNTASLGGTAGAPQSYSGSQVIVSTGKVGTGYIRLNANPNNTATPYIDIVERTGSAIYDIQLKARLGDLSGLANSDLVFNRSNPGFGLATDNVFLQGGITATFGTIGGFAITSNAISSSNNNLILRDSGQITGSNVLFSGGKVANWHIIPGKLVGQDGASERIRLDAKSGELQIDGDDALGITIGGSSTALESVTSLPFFVAAKDDGSRTIFRVGDANQFIKFDTGGTPKLFISSSNYLLGGSSQFISGSNGNIEISSSNFHLDRDGNVNMSGTITATAGEIGGFSIDGHSLSTTGVEINDSTQTLFISSSAFKVDHTGNITGSQVLFEGGRITNGVTIEGSVTADSIRTPATIAGSPSTTANASSSIDSDGFAKFVSASIAGFEITNQQIRAADSESIIATTVSASFEVTMDTSDNGHIHLGNFVTNASNYSFWSSSLSRGSDDAGNAFTEVFVKRTAGSFTGKSFLRGGVFQVEGQIENDNFTPSNPFDDFVAEIALVSGDTVAFTTTEDPGVFCKSDESVLTLVSHSIVSTPSLLRLKSDGQITASNANISGKIVTEDITATGGTIGGLSLSNTSLSTTEYVISSSTNTNDPVSFISSSAFKVSAGGNITGSQVLFTGGEIGGTIIESDKLKSTSNLASPDSSPTFELDSSGVISGSNLYVRKVTDFGSGDEVIPLLDTRIGLLDGRNLGRQLVSNYDEFVRSNVDDDFTYVTVNEHFVQLLPYENTLLISYQLRVDATGNGVLGGAKFQLQSMTHSGSFTSATNFDNFTDAAAVTTTSVTRTISGTSLYIAAGALAAKLTIPESAQAQTCRIQVEMINNMISGLAASPSNKTTLKGYSIIATRALSANTAGDSAKELNKGS